MLVAGSVLALLLMGLAVDGFLSMDDPQPGEDPDGDNTGGDDQDDQSGVTSSALSDFLFLGNEGEADDPADGDTAPDDEDRALDLAQSPLGAPNWFADTLTDEDEEDADTDWALAADTAPASDFVEVEEFTGLSSGEEVAYVETFDTETDALILEFDGADDDAPDITIDLESEQDAAIVLANGVPVTLVEGATDMTPDHVRVVMTPEVLPSTQDMDDPMADATTAPDPASTEADLAVKPDAPLTPSVLPSQELLESGTDPFPIDQIDPVPEVPDEVEVILGDVTETVIDPVTDVVDTLTDGLPTDEVINGLLDGIADTLADLGGSSEMLDARVAIDDAFGTGGEDALTGGYNDDMITGSDGQDALFGDEGNDTLNGGGGNDELHGDTGDDLLQGGDGVDFLDGGDGNDSLDGGAGRDLLFGGDGDDVIAGGVADDFLSGGMGADTLNGGSGNDVLDGTYGSNGTDRDDGDVLWGGDGDDTIIIGQGDIAHGNAGADLFSAGSYIESAEVAGSVADFDPGQDRIEVIFDPALDPHPVLEVLDFEDGSGADIILNGEVILSVTGAQGLDPNMIDLRAVA